ncbi:hypothetical protein [Actinoplanes utahensis]|uniref:hypothetical protein n=1 Tax=Actinoplanes utahensis TaxID=1869 RepID=UPI0006919485|nr:hypothetical protein [Actinoplanes utahensis]GIF33605.1 hypothetical protein Aut01nite_65910 [Actinoplanes utahensis]
MAACPAPPRPARSPRPRRRSVRRGLAAAVTYYAFFATFAFVLLGFSAFGFVLDRPEAQQALQRYLAENLLPSLDVEQIRVARGTIGVIAFLGLPITGWFWSMPCGRPSARCGACPNTRRGTVGLLYSLNIINQLVLPATALAAASVTGAVTDLSARGGSPRCSTGPVS